MTVRHPGGAGVGEEAVEALRKLREEAAWSTWMEEGGSDGALARPTTYGLDCTRSAYQCAPCRYALHPACARVRRTVRHPAHPEHPLSLRLATPYQSGIYTCDACRTGGHEFVLHCQHCQFDLHLPCAALPAEVVASRAHPHPHPLRLAYDNPHRGGQGVVIICTVCRQGIIPEQWLYGCHRCDDFAAHVGCAVPDAQIKRVYPRIDMQRVRAEQEASQTAALLQQYQQMSALNSAQSSMFASNAASMLGVTLEGLKLGARMSDDNLAINFNKSGTGDQIRKREEYYRQVM
ncbi:protein VACUOLELESS GAMETOPHYTES-like [Miscanthus floridulus]|uniref:protein VACUOLELESS GAMETOPHYTES-like n=1 Tax=Miscanthus floridulus TaxID=154761 RepID=UPI003458F474